MRSMASAVAAVTQLGPGRAEADDDDRGGRRSAGTARAALVVVGPLGRGVEPGGRIWWLLGSHVPYSAATAIVAGHARLQELVHGRGRLVGDVLLGRHRHVGLHLLVGQHGHAVDHEHVPAQLASAPDRPAGPASPPAPPWRSRRRAGRPAGTVPSALTILPPRASLLVSVLSLSTVCAKSAPCCSSASTRLASSSVAQQDVAHAQLAEAAGVGVVGGLGLGVVDRATAEGVLQRDDGGGLGQRPVLEPLREGVEDVGAAGLVEAGEGLGPHRGVVGRPQRQPSLLDLLAHHLEQDVSLQRRAGEVVADGAVG